MELSQFIQEYSWVGRPLYVSSTDLRDSHTGMLGNTAELVR